MISGVKSKSVGRLESIIGSFLRIGALFSGFLLFSGWLLNLKLNGEQLRNFSQYDESSLAEILEWAFFLNEKGTLLIVAGLVLLILLPLVRVLLTGFLLALQKEYLLSFMAFLVSSALLFSFYLGIGI